MPELPEVETVRKGVELGTIRRTVSDVWTGRDRALRRHVAGPVDFASRLTGRAVTGVHRRGKFLWLALDSDEAMVAHLGMSGQLLVVESEVAVAAHTHARIRFTDEGRELRFVDQRTFGGLAIEPLTEGRKGRVVPTSVAHIAPDPLEESFSVAEVGGVLKQRRTGLKRALLDQQVVSGIGNIYADEALWRAKLHFARATDTLRRPEIERTFAAVDEVLREALLAGGTSFDGLYVSAFGVSGYFERELQVYGRHDRACRRCGAQIRRDSFMNRSSHTCPICQPRPRNGRW